MRQRLIEDGRDTCRRLELFSAAADHGMVPRQRGQRSIEAPPPQQVPGLVVLASSYCRRAHSL